MTTPRAGSQNARILAVLADGDWLANHDRRDEIMERASIFPSTDEQRKWVSRVDIGPGCWLWTGPTFPRAGHGHCYVRKGGTRYAHRWAYTWFVGEIPHGLEIDHLCRVSPCVNPTHLEAVTHAENVRRGLVPLIFGARTHCKNGHEFTPENTKPRSDGNGRLCLTCADERLKRYRDRHRDRVRQRDREAKRRQADMEGKRERWPGRVHPTLGGGS